MAVVARKRKGGRVSYYVCNRLHGQMVWEHVGADKREAQRRDAAMKREIRDGHYQGKRTGGVTVAREAAEFFRARTVRTVDNELSLFRNHIEKRCEWFLTMRLEDVRPAHIAKLVDDLEQPYVNDHGKPAKLCGKSVALVYGIVRTMFQEAVLRERILSNPCVLKRGRLKKTATKKRVPYGAEDVVTILGATEAPLDGRIFAAIAFFSGMRQGEVCGRRWRDLDAASKPLGCMTVLTQYNDKPLKTDRPRQVPVHADLAKLLAWWRSTGWEFVYLRKPRPDDFILPHRDDLGAHTKSSSYKLWRRTLEKAEVANLSLHSSRHAFITLARRGGARKDVLEKVTHNAGGDIVDQYTHWDWDPLCEAVSCFPNLLSDSLLDSFANPAIITAPAPGLEPVAQSPTVPNTRKE